MRHTEYEGRGPVRYGPPPPEPGLPVLPGLAAAAARAAGRAHGEPPGGGPALWTPPAATGPRHAFLGATKEERLAALDAPEPSELPHVRQALSVFAASLDGLRAQAQRTEPPR
ncbi:hypothetical protein SALBM135S_06458 [Streptomyces alboniger]